MGFLTTKQDTYKVLKTLGGDDTALVWSGSSQTVDIVEERHSTIEKVDILPRQNAAIVVFHGTAAENKVMDWMLVGWRAGGPAEHIATGTATLGTQRVDTATSTELWADTISITTQTHLAVLSVVDSGNNRIAKLAFDLCGFKHIAAVCDNAASNGTTLTGAKIAFI